MDFTYDDEQVALREAVRGLVGKAYGDHEQRRQRVNEDPGYDEGLWGRLAEMGVLGLPFAESDGGMGAGPIEVGLVAEELGRVIAPEPFLASVVLAGSAVSLAGSDEQRSSVLGALAEGDVLLALAHAEPGSRWQPFASAVVATKSGDDWTLEGTKEPVLHGARADRLVVSAALPEGGTGLFLVTPDSTVTREGYPTHDGGRAARITFSATPAEQLGDGGDATDLVEAALTTARLAAASEALGAMDVALSTTTEYLKSRKQFGVPLNTFQALVFRAADMYVELELARSTVLWATMVLASAGARSEEAQRAAARAGHEVSRAARHIGQEAIQLHGGIAMTAEYSVGNYTSRLTALDHLFGDGDHHLRTLAAGIGAYDEVDPLG